MCPSGQPEPGTSQTPLLLLEIHMLQRFGVCLFKKKMHATHGGGGEFGDQPLTSSHLILLSHKKE